MSKYTKCEKCKWLKTCKYSGVSFQTLVMSNDDIRTVIGCTKKPPYGFVIG